MKKPTREERFFAAAWNGNAGELESMLKNIRKAKRLVDARIHPMGVTCLHLAENAECVRILLSYGADPNARVLRSVDGSRTKGVTPIIYVASGERIAKTRGEALRLLLNAGARVNEASDSGQTALHNAVDIVATQLLLTAGADVNAVDVDHWTALHFAERAEQARALLAAGSDVHAKDVEGREPLYYAKSVEQALCLIEAGACIDDGVLAHNAFVAEAYAVHENRLRLEHAEAAALARPRHRA